MYIATMGCRSKAVSWMQSVVLVLALFQWQTACSARGRKKPHAVQNVTVTTINDSTALVKYDLPIKKWKKDKESYTVVNISVRVRSLNTTSNYTNYRRNISPNITSHIVTGLPPFEELEYIIRPVSSVRRRLGYLHRKVMFRLRSPVDGVWSNWTVVKECRASISCDEYRDGSLVLDLRRVSTRHCTAPRYRGKPCAGDGERNETCPPLSPPTCNATQDVTGEGVNDQEETQTLAPPAQLSLQSLALLIALSITLPACVIVAIFLLLSKYYQARNYPSAVSTSQPKTFSLDNFSVNISEEGNGTYLDWYMSCGDLAPVDERPAVYICYGHNLPTPKFDEHYQQVQELVSALRNDGIPVIFPDSDVHSLMQNIEEWFESMQPSLVKIIVLCSEDLVRRWKDVTKLRCLETASARLAYREYNCIKDAIQQGNIDIQPVVLGSTRADTDTAAIVPALLRDKNLKPLILDNPADDRRFREWMRACCDDNVSGGCSDDSHQHTPPIHRSLSESSASKLAGMECSQEALPSLPSRDCTCSIRSTFEVSSRSLGQNMPPRSKELEESNSTQPCDEQPPVTSHLCTATDEKTSIRQECHDVPLYLVAGDSATAFIEDSPSLGGDTVSTFSLQVASQEVLRRASNLEPDDVEYRQKVTDEVYPEESDCMPVRVLTSLSTNCNDNRCHQDVDMQILHVSMARRVSAPSTTEFIARDICVTEEVMSSGTPPVDSAVVLELPHDSPPLHVEVPMSGSSPEEELATTTSTDRGESNKTSLSSGECASVSLTSHSPEPRLEEAVAFGPVTTQFLHVSNARPHTVGTACANPLALHSLHLNTPGMLQPMLQQISIQQAQQCNETSLQAYGHETQQQVNSNSVVSPTQPVMQPVQTPITDQPFLSWLRNEL